MKITPDSNVLVRALVSDDDRQTKAAQAALADATEIALPIPVLCELVWVLSHGYKISAMEIAEKIRVIANSRNVVMNRPAVELGLAMLEAGGDFADGAIAYEGSWLGAETFLSFDKKAVMLLDQYGQSARLLQ
jgi:predicted nucleic-acid-binding protein